MEFSASITKPPLPALFVLNATNRESVIKWGQVSKLSLKGVVFTTDASIMRYLALSDKPGNWFGTNILQEAEVNHWVSFSVGPLSSPKEFEDAIAYLDKVLTPLTYFVADQCTLADIAVFSKLLCNEEFLSLRMSGNAPQNLVRWFNVIGSKDFVKKTLSGLPANVVLVDKKEIEIVKKEEGKFVELPGAEMGKVVVRFPPEASGYLHIGHAKAALLNQHYKNAFNGKLIMRFDDTNPAKEKTDFEKVILEDLKLLQIPYDLFSYTSNFFPKLLEYCEKLIKGGKAYVDDTDAEVMKDEREKRIQSKNRDNPVEINMAMWSEMLKGSEIGQKCCVRAKIDMSSLNGCMRDPTIYRCKNEPHPRTGLKYKVYPTYDFACPIVDSLEGVTHCLRTMEYHDRDEQFYWFIDTLNLRKPHIWEYSRLNMVNTVLSKRKLTWFVDNELVQGWDDPRMPTVRGILRRGMTVEGLKQFIISQGSSRSVVVMDWDKIWAINKKVIDPVSPRYTAVDANNHVLVQIPGVKIEPLKVAKHPKNPSVGDKTVWIAPEVIVDKSDADLFKENENVTFINWGNILIKEIIRKDGKVTSVKAQLNLDDKNYKKTLKVTWLAKSEKSSLIPCTCLYFDHIISKPILGKNEDFKDFINKDSLKVVETFVDPELSNLKVGEIVQIQRKGFFICDRAYQPRSLHTCAEVPIALISIPDGTKDAEAFAAVKTEKIVASNPSCKTLEIDLLNEISKQGEVVRDLKSKKIDKASIDAQVKILLGLKADFKTKTGKDWSPELVKKLPETKQDKPTVSVDEILLKISKQGDLIRSMKSNKADKQALEGQIKILLDLKNQFKIETGKDWTIDLAKKTENLKISVSQPEVVNADAVSLKIKEQGDRVRNFKNSKADKSCIDKEVKMLLELKSQYKTLAGKDWSPETVKNVEKPVENIKGDDLLAKIQSQGDLIRKMKSDKADKQSIGIQVKILLELKEDYKATTGQEWTPKLAGPNEKKSEPDLMRKITEQGDLIRKMKNDKLDKAAIEAEVKILLDLKSKFKQETGKDWTPDIGKLPSNKPQQGKPNVKESKENLNKKNSKNKNEPKPSQDASLKKITRVGLEAEKETNLPEWYSQVLTKGEMIEYYDVSGCYILRPWSFSIWEQIKDWLDNEIKKLGVKNCYFPIFVSSDVLQKEKSHIADFAPEVAWVTKSGDTDLAKPIAVRPTSETVMYPAYAKWIQSYRDLPIKLNQWNNVVRWEFKHPQPFLRTREFLWQEGHTAFATFKEAEEEVGAILELYAKVYTDLLAIPVVKGRKTEKEKFAGAQYTLTVEAYISASGRAIQGGTSHHLGQNFSKMFDIVYEDPETQEKKFVFQNSWGLTTRTIGVLIMVHADNQGLVLPPKVASVQIIIVPCGITVNLPEEDKNMLLAVCKKLECDLVESDVRAEADLRDNVSPGWKYNHWELKGVPIRVEVGPKDLSRDGIVAARRDTGEKIFIGFKNVVADLISLLDSIQSNLLEKATKELNEHMVVCNDWKDFCPHLDNKKIIQAPFCGEIDCEDNIKNDSARAQDEDTNAPSMGAKSLCIPFTPLAAHSPDYKCIHPKCTKKSKYYTLFGRSY